MQHQELIPHLFRTEYRKIISVLCRTLGIEHIELAEDIVSDTFLLASETWGQKGLPANPTAWLYAVSKNKARDLFRHNKIFSDKIAKELKQADIAPEPEIDLSESNIHDSQLQMMFAVCHPSIPPEAQIGLALNVLCGFGAEEIADAFLTNKEAVYKRLARAKEKLREEKIAIALPPASEIAERMNGVLTTLYLLFSEGYYSTSQNTTLRKDLCLEALRLNLMLVEHAPTNTPPANALLSLMCFHASRFEARTGQNGEIVLYEQQDENLWNLELIEKGIHYLNKASTGTKLSKFHIEAAIAYWHTHKGDTPEKWENILQLYNRLLQLEYSPMAALNRTYALARANGVDEAIAEAEKLQLHDNHLYHMLLATLQAGKSGEKQLFHLQKALQLAKTTPEKNMITARLAALKA